MDFGVKMEGKQTPIIYLNSHTESTSAESSSFNDSAVALLPRGSCSEPGNTPEVTPRGRLPLSLSPLLRESADCGS